MLRISTTQKRTLDQASIQQFHEASLRRMHEIFPGHARYLGPRATRHLVEQGHRLAEKSGFNTERDIRLYTDLMIMLGAGFETDPQLPWAREVLDDSSYAGVSRMEALWDRAMAYLDSTVGARSVFPAWAYQADRQLRARLIRSGKLGFKDVISYFFEIWPQKVSYIGARRLQEALSLFTFWNIDDSVVRSELSICCFLFGHRFFEDPVFPWAASIVANASKSDASITMSQINAEFDNYINVALHM
jgi:hypothetical protein